MTQEQHVLFEIAMQSKCGHECCAEYVNYFSFGLFVRLKLIGSYSRKQVDDNMTDEGIC